MARDPLPWLATTVRGLQKKILDLESALKEKDETTPKSSARYLCLEELVPYPLDRDLQASDQISVLLHALQPVNSYEAYISEDDYEDPRWRIPSAALNPNCSVFIPQKLVGADLDKQVRFEPSSSEFLENTIENSKSMTIENVEETPDSSTFDRHAVDVPMTIEKIENLDKNAPRVDTIATTTLAPTLPSGPSSFDCAGECHDNEPVFTVGPDVAETPVDQFPSQFYDLCLSLRSLRLKSYREIDVLFKLFICDFDDLPGDAISVASDDPETLLSEAARCGDFPVFPDDDPRYSALVTWKDLDDEIETILDVKTLKFFEELSELESRLVDKMKGMENRMKGVNPIKDCEEKMEEQIATVKGMIVEVSERQSKMIADKVISLLSSLTERIATVEQLCSLFGKVLNNG